eukprot:TRINITY_DN8591_c0_g1_i1.p1 TRINITY_DN8591_c0_g1~~TRINITY_DN8591_c0_g1_i1.p1  ORF type:complete len:236 (+),score=81.04 TRINITY_DN8591_c0_g1_i1:52-759(+)
MSTYLENYLESISTLPAELRRNFSLMRELDDRTKDTSTRVEEMMVAYQSGNKKNLKELFTDEQIQQMREELENCVSHCDEKVSLAVQTYDLVDKHIRRLDQDLKKFEAELEDERKQQQQVQSQTLKSTGGKKLAAAQGTGLGKVPRKKDQKAVDARGPIGVNGVPLAAEVEMPIDPNEPTYCTCGRVSFGEMIGCDNAECAIEWFHFECVGLSGPVKGKWYCPDCAAKMKKDKKK